MSTWLSKWIRIQLVCLRLFLLHVFGFISFQSLAITQCKKSYTNAWNMLRSQLPSARARIHHHNVAYTSEWIKSLWNVTQMNATCCFSSRLNRTRRAILLLQQQLYTCQCESPPHVPTMGGVQCWVLGLGTWALSLGHCAWGIGHS